jgi:calcineurin-like phosphoesterase family protein
MKIALESHQSLFFTSDTHYSHKNIVRGVSSWPQGRGTRDFHSIGEMNAAIVNSINSKVSADDILIHLGDWSFGGFESINEFREKIICKNIVLFLGNHDEHIKKNKNEVQNNFIQVSKYSTVDIKRPEGKSFGLYQFVCCHFPLATWEGIGKGVPHLHGHIHLPPHLKIHEGKAMDVGMDGNNLQPYSLNSILSIMRDRPIKNLVLPKDHHLE